MRIALDAMGGDGAPTVEIEGALAAAKQGAEVILVGPEARLRKELRRLGGEKLVRTHPADEVVTMEDSPSSGFKRKPNSSMRVCFELVRKGEAEAVVSAGNSGVMLACGLFVLGRIAGVDRPAIATTFPLPDGECALLDMGANVDLKPSTLAQFAVLGAVYARLLHGKERVRVGLLSNGAEEHKGTALTRATHALLSAPAVPLDFDYRGYVEGRDIFGGTVDVVVTDGFTGNIVLKTAEGVAEAITQMVRRAAASGPLGKAGGLLLRRSFREMKRRLDWAEVGGAPLLGVKGVTLVCHGASPPKAIKNAIAGARRFHEVGLSSTIEQAIARHAPVWQGAAPQAAAGRSHSRGA